MAKPRKKYSDLNIQDLNYVKKKLNITKKEDIDTTILKTLKEKLKIIKDTRCKNMVIYKLWDVIMCVIIASFADNNTWDEIHHFVVDNYAWFKSFLQMTGGIPTADSYERIMSLVDSKELNEILFDFFKSITTDLHPEVEMNNLDGRVNNGSKRNISISGNSKTPLNCLNINSNKYGYCFYTTEIDSKTNEIPAVEEAIKGLNLKGVIVSWDALNTQIKNVDAVIKAGGDYTVPIKGNHSLFYEELVEYFDDDRCDEIKAGNLNSEYLTYSEKSHGKLIIYELYQTSDVKWYSNLSDWNELHTFGLVKKTIIQKRMEKNTRKNAKDKEKKIEKEIVTVEKRYYISSKQVNINEFNYATRNHWSIENKIHFHLDFTFCQDKNSTTNKKALLNLEIIHKFNLAVLERTKPRYKQSLRLIRKHLSNNIKEFFPEFICYLLLS